MNLKIKHSRITTYFLLIASIIAFIGSIVQASANGLGDCSSGYVSKDEDTPFSYSGSSVIEKVFVKSGSLNQGQACFPLTQANPSDGCYSAQGLGTSNVTVSGGGSSSDCQSISHVEFYSHAGCGLLSPCPTIPSGNTPTLTPTSTPTATNTPTSTPTNTPTSTSTPTPTPLPTDTPVSTPSPDPTSTSVPTSIPTTTPSDPVGGDDPSTNTPIPTNTHTPTPTPIGPTQTPVPSPTTQSHTNITLVSTTKTVLGTSTNFNPLLESIKQSFGGSVLGTNTFFPQTGTVTFALDSNLPSGNRVKQGEFIRIPQLALDQPLFQSQTLGDELLVGYREILETKINQSHVIYGHNYPSVFGSLYKLDIGSSILIDRQGHVVLYSVVQKQLVPPDSVDTLSQASDGDIFLVTCSYTYPDLRLLIRASINR